MPSMQAIVTPWKNKQELRMLKRQFYDADDDDDNNKNTTAFGSSKHSDSNDSRKRRRRACDLVHVWEISGSTPHAIVATADLTNALLFDLERRGGAADKLGIYMSAWTRFIDGMTDTMQIYRVKRSMWEIAAELGMPASFVELRHRCVHEQKPALHEMQRATRQGLAWLFGYFWTYIENPTEPKDGAEETIDVVSTEVVEMLDTLLRDYLDTCSKSKSVKGKGSDQKVTEQLRSTVDGVNSLCRGSPEKLRCLAESIVNVFLPSGPGQSRTEAMTANNTEISRLFELEPLLLGISRKTPLFVAILDEELLASVVAPRSDQSPQLRACAATTALHMRESNNWEIFRSRALLHESSTIGACLASPLNDWSATAALLMGSNAA